MLSLAGSDWQRTWTWPSLEEEWKSTAGGTVDNWHKRWMSQTTGCIWRTVDSKRTRHTSWHYEYANWQSTYWQRSVRLLRHSTDMHYADRFLGLPTFWQPVPKENVNMMALPLKIAELWRGITWCIITQTIRLQYVNDGSFRFAWALCTSADNFSVAEANQVELAVGWLQLGRIIWERVQASV